MSNINWKNIVARAVWTFFQGAIGTLTVLPYISDATGWQNAASAALAGGVAALVSFIKTLGQETLSPSSEPVSIPRVEVEPPTEDN